MRRMPVPPEPDYQDDDREDSEPDDGEGAVPHDVGARTAPALPAYEVAAAAVRAVVGPVERQICGNEEARRSNQHRENEANSPNHETIVAPNSTQTARQMTPLGPGRGRSGNAFLTFVV